MRRAWARGGWSCSLLPSRSPQHCCGLRLIGPAHRQGVAGDQFLELADQIDAVFPRVGGVAGNHALWLLAVALERDYQVTEVLRAGDHQQPPTSIRRARRRCALSSHSDARRSTSPSSDRITRDAMHRSRRTSGEATNTVDCDREKRRSARCVASPAVSVLTFVRVVSVSTIEPSFGRVWWPGRVRCLEPPCAAACYPAQGPESLLLSSSSTTSFSGSVPNVGAPLRISSAK